MTEPLTYRVTLVRPGTDSVSFDGRASQSIAKAAAQAGYAMTTGCLQGRCAICRSVLRDGVVAPSRKASPNAAGDPVNRADGCVLPCSVAPRSDVVLEPLSPWYGQGRP